jgi:hypothetical protein
MRARDKARISVAAQWLLPAAMLIAAVARVI